MHKTLTVPGIAAVVALIIGFGAGYYVPHANAGGDKGQYAQFAGRAGARGAVAGQIISTDAGSITVKMQNGSTELVLISTSTPILKSTQGSISDLASGTFVVVAGTPNGDGSLTAQSVQIRPAGAAGGGMMGGSNAPMMRYTGQ